MLNSAIAAGKRVRTETSIARGAVSVSSAAGEFSALQLKEFTNDKISIKDANIAILGAGKMSKLLVTHLQSLGVRDVKIVNRSPDRVNELRSAFPDMNLEYFSMGDMWSVIKEADIVFPSTKSNITLVDPIPLKECIATRAKSSPLLFMDISVPRNVHPDCAQISDNVKCYNVDDLKAVVNRNTMKRQKEIISAEKILKEETDAFLSWQQSLKAVPTITKLQEKAEEVRVDEFNKMLKKLSKLSEKDLENVTRLSKGIVAKLLHGPMQHLRQHRDGVSEVNTAINQLQQAFQL
jgi:glutamyl-tRNA reductase